MPNVERMGYRRLGQAGMKVSTFGLGGWLTACHSTEDIERTVTAIAEAIEMLKAEGMVG